MTDTTIPLDDSTAPNQSPKPCPTCGACPTCGRAWWQYQPPAIPLPIYPPTTPSPWWQIPPTTCGGGA